MHNTLTSTASNTDRQIGGALIVYQFSSQFGEIRFMNKHILLATTVLIAGVISTQAANAGGKSFPKLVPTLDGALNEGFAIGKGHTAYNGSIDGSIYKVNLRSGEGEILVERQGDFNLETDCFKLGMRVDPRSNYLFVAGCQVGNVYVFDADSGDLIMDYQMPLPAGFEGGFQIVNDLTITKNAVYLTDSHQPLLYKIPLSKNGGLPDADAITAIELIGDFVNIPPEHGCCGANGIVSSPNGKTLIVGHSNFAQLFNVDPDTGYATEIQLDQSFIPFAFLDGMALGDGILYVLSPYPEGVHVIGLDDDMLNGVLLDFITDPDLDGVASGAIFGGSLYVNNAQYETFPGPDKPNWVTKLSVYDAD